VVLVSHNMYSGSSIVEPVVTSTICVCARPSGDKIVKEMASSMAVLEKVNSAQFFKEASSYAHD